MIKLGVGKNRKYEVRVNCWMTDSMKPYYTVYVNDVALVSCIKYERAREICFKLIEEYNSNETNNLQRHC